MTIKERYTGIEKRNGRYVPLLGVGNQTFMFIDFETKPEADWYRDRVVEALEKFLEENNGKS
jgi:hypothetical protein